MNKSLNDLLERVRSWPEGAQEELERLGREIESELTDGTYSPTPSELLGIDRGLAAAETGEFVTPEAVEAVFAKYRGA